MAEDRKKSRDVDPDVPIRFLAAEGERIDHTPRRGADHRDLQPRKRLRPARHFIDQPENELTFPPVIAGIDQFPHIGRSMRRFKL